MGRRSWLFDDNLPLISEAPGRIFRVEFGRATEALALAAHLSGLVAHVENPRVPRNAAAAGEMARSFCLADAVAPTGDPAAEGSRRTKRGNHRGEPDQIGGAARLQLAGDVRAMDFDCPETDAELARDYLVGLAGGNQSEHFAFPGG